MIGEFSNSGDDRIYAESADRISKDGVNGVFAEEYYQTWCNFNDDGSVEGVVAKLTIKEISPNIFSLKWDIRNDANGEFWGEGMLCDGMLIGDYQNFKIF